MSPEQARGQPVDHRSDVYSFGVILYEGMAGRRPFDANTLYDLLRLHIEERPPPLSSFRQGVPAALESIVMRALEKDPALRFQSATELAQALAQAAQFLPAEAWALPTTSLPPGTSATMRSPGGTPAPFTPAPTMPANTSTGGAALDLGSYAPKSEPKSAAPWLAIALGGGFVVLIIVAVIGIAVLGFASSSALAPSAARPVPTPPVAPTPASTDTPTPPQLAPADDKPLVGRYRIAASIIPRQDGNYSVYTPSPKARRPSTIHRSRHLFVDF